MRTSMKPILRQSIDRAATSVALLSLVWWGGIGCSFIEDSRPYKDAQVIVNNRRGIESLKSKENLKAQNNFLDALRYEPFNPGLKMNLGLTYLIRDDHERATRVFESVAQGDSVESAEDQKFEALFNLAIAHSANKKIEEALHAYQLALEIKPDSVEVKTNIELLLQGGEGQGEGEGESSGQDQKNEPKQGGGDPQNQPKQKKLEGKDLSSEDVRKILEELKDQDNRVRAQEIQKGQPKENRSGKDY